MKTFRLIITAILLLFILGIMLYHLAPYRIEQDINNCNDDKHLQVRTYVFRFGSIIYSDRSWQTDFCADFSNIDSVKSAEYLQAKEFIKKYKSIQ